MNTRTFAPTLRRPVNLLATAAALSILAAGCFTDSGNNNSSDAVAAVQGRLQGDVEATGMASSSGWEGAVVTAHDLNVDGTLGSAHDSATVNADGSFRLETRRTGHQDWVLRARRGAEEWMTRFEGTLEADQTRDCRPMNLESTLEAAVLLELKKSMEGREVHSAEVSAAIDADVAASSRGAYRGAESARAALVAQAAASVKAASRARHKFLMEAEAQYQANRARIDSARARAEVELNASLSAHAGDTGASRNAERAYLAALVQAYLSAEIERTDYARSAEASYHAMVRASAQISDSARTAMARNYARILAIASDTAMREEFRAAGASQARLQLVIDAGARFRGAVDTAGTRDRVDSAVARFRADVRAAFQSTADTGFSVFATVASNASVTTMMDSLSGAIQSSIGASTEGSDVGDAYAEAHTEAQAELLTRFEAVNNNEDEAAAAANLFAFLSVRAGLN